MSLSEPPFWINKINSFVVKEDFHEVQTRILDFLNQCQECESVNYEQNRIVVQTKNLETHIYFYTKNGIVVFVNDYKCKTEELDNIVLYLELRKLFN